MDRVRVMMWAAVLLVAPAGMAAPRKQRQQRKPAAAAPAPTPAAHGEVMPPDADAPPVIGTPQHAEGDYGGVVPGQTPKSDTHRFKHPPPKGTLAWIGFEAKGGGAEVFFQSIAAFDLAQHVENGVLVVNLTGLSRLGQNTWRPIDAHYFASPISRIVARRVGAGKGHAAGIEVRIAFKNAKDAHEATFRSATEADGYYYAYLSFAGAATEPVTTPSE